MRKIWVVKAACLVFLQAALFSCPPVYTVRAAAPAQEEADAGERTRAAGRILTDVMELIGAAYAGDSVAPEALYEAALRGMMDLLDDYSEYLDEEELESFTQPLTGRLTGIGVVMRLDAGGQPGIVRVLADSPASEAGLRKGDIITQVNGVSTAGKTTADIAALITGSTRRGVNVTVSRGGKPHTYYMLKREINSVTVQTERLEDIFGPSAREEASVIRYITVTHFSAATAADMRNAAALCKKEGVTGIILDLRGNTGGYLDAVTDIGKWLVPRGAVYHTVDSQGARKTVYSSQRAAPFKKIAVLTDRETASASELITAALQDAGAAVVFGETTFGKGLIQSLFTLPAGGAVKLTTEEYLRRNGQPINRIGVQPDVAVGDMDAFDYGTEKDTALAAALAWITDTKN